MTREDYDLLFKIYHNASTLASNLARENIRVLSKLACMGLISTHNSKEYSGRWLITAQGIQALHQYTTTED